MTAEVQAATAKMCYSKHPADIVTAKQVRGPFEPELVVG